MFDFWNSVLDLRRIELILLLLGMITPVLCGSLLLTLRSRVRNLIDQSQQSEGYSHHETTRKLESQKQGLVSELMSARRELNGLQRVTAPRQLSEMDARLLIDQLRGIHAAPVLVAAYNFEEESYGYASQIAAALRQAGWDVRLNKASMNDFKGITVGSVNLMRRPVAGQRELSQALEAAHVDIHQREISPDSIAGSLEDGSLLVVVGRK
jgi:hypothetical protein